MSKRLPKRSWISPQRRRRTTWKSVIVPAATAAQAAEDRSSKRRRWWTTSLEIIAVVGGLAAVITLWLDYLANIEQSYNSAWTSINSAYKLTVDGGRRRALIYLKRKGQSLQGAPLEDSFLSYAKLDGADLNRSNMTNADLFGADLRDAKLWGAHMKDASLQFARLQGANLLRADLRCADLRGAHLERLEVNEYGIMNILRRHLSRDGDTDLSDAKLHFAHLEGADLRHASLKGAKLKYAHLGKYINKFEADKVNEYKVYNEYNEYKVYKVKEDKVDAEMEDCERENDGLIDIISDDPEKPSAAEICRWALCHRSQDDHIELPEHFSCLCPDCPGNLLCSTIKHKGLPEALKHVLKSAINPAANLTGADLTGADLTGADLTGSVLQEANLKSANLTDAVGVTEPQIEAARCLCNTTLPRYIPRRLSNRDCDDVNRCKPGDIPPRFSSQDYDDAAPCADKKSN